MKYDVDGWIERYKARLVARGFTQTYGLDYDETIALVAKMNTVWVLFLLAVNLVGHFNNLMPKIHAPEISSAIVFSLFLKSLLESLFLFLCFPFSCFLPELKNLKSTPLPAKYSPAPLPFWRSSGPKDPPRANNISICRKEVGSDKP